MRASQFGMALLGSLIISAHAASVARTVEVMEMDVEHNASRDKITNLPGYKGNFSQFNHHAGYVTVGETNTKHLFYYLARARISPETAPVVLWLNGGPGCSSMDGFAYELGPFNFRLLDDDELEAPHRVELTDNPKAWANIANMVFLDSPAGVGLSYSDNPFFDYNTGDVQTAADAHEFLRKFFKRHPELQNNTFFIAGESYGGIYVPNLAKEVVLGNDKGIEPHINIEGYMVGNGCTDDKVDGNAHPPFVVGKSMMPMADYKALEVACGGSYWDRAAGSDCDIRFNQMMKAVSQINLYDILEDCYSGYEPDFLSTTLQAAMEKHGFVWPMVGATPKSGSQVLNWAHLGLTPPCTDARQVATWLNDRPVRQALHAKPSARIGRFTLCADQLTYTKEHNGSMIPVHKMLIEEHGLRALIYSGDHDMCVPHTGSEEWTAGMGYPVKHAWQPWFVQDHLQNSQVAGFTVAYEKDLTYATIKGAGHMVPETNPISAFQMFKRFIFNEPLIPPAK